MVPTPRRDERQNSRRNARRETNRAEILDAAEIVFAQTGIHNASMRSIAAEAGFSPAAMYLFFEGRQHLLAATLTRRGDELNELLTATVAEAPEPLAALHAVIDATLAFFARRAEFRQMLRERGGPAIMGPPSPTTPTMSTSDSPTRRSSCRASSPMARSPAFSDQEIRTYSLTSIWCS